MFFPRFLLVAIALGGAFASIVPAASNPFAGKWKFNASKSKVTGTTDSIAAAGANAWKFTYGSYSWTLKADGTDQPTPFGNTVALKVVSPTTWQLTDKVKGKVTATETWVLADDGQSMTRTSAGKRETGEAFTDVLKEKRTAGAKGFEGTWETAEFKGAPPEVDIENASDTGLTIVIPAEGLKFAATFDGKENPVEGPRVPPGMTVSAKLVSPRKVAATSKMKDKVLDTETWEVSADGKTFTYTELDAGETKPTVSVYDRI
jgi:hypothetical protein